MSQLAAMIRADDPARRRRAAARLMTRLQDRPQELPALLRALDPLPEPDLVLGITGMPGSGKSTLADALIARWRARDPGAPIGIIAIDPSSAHGGAMLGDRIRMMRHADDEGVFIRSLAARGTSGGLTIGLQGVLAVLRRLECRFIIIETVGVGQNEVEIVRAADATLLVLAPGHGDAIQLLKSGLMEIGDLIAINKSDRDDAAQVHRDLLATLSLKGGVAGDEMRVLLISAIQQTGLDALMERLDDMAARRREGWIEHRRSALERELGDLIRREASRLAQDAIDRGGLIARVRDGELSVADAAELALRGRGDEQALRPALRNSAD